MSAKIKGQPDTVAKTESSSAKPITTTVEKNDPTKPMGEADSTEVQLDPDTLASVELLVEQASKAEPQAVKFMVSSGVVQCYQGRLISKAKKVLKTKSKNEGVVEETIAAIYAKFDLGKAAMNRRAQLWDEAVYQEVISLDLQKRIAMATELSTELFTEMETELGSVTGTELMRKLGILPAKEEKKPRIVKPAKVRLKEKTKLMETLLSEIKDLLVSPDLLSEVKDKAVLDGYWTDYRQLETAVTKFKTIGDGIIVVPDFGPLPSIV